MPPQSQLSPQRGNSSANRILSFICLIKVQSNPVYKSSFRSSLTCYLGLLDILLIVKQKKVLHPTSPHLTPSHSLLLWLDLSSLLLFYQQLARGINRTPSLTLLLLLAICNNPLFPSMLNSTSNPTPQLLLRHSNKLLLLRRAPFRLLPPLFYPNPLLPL